MSEEDGQNIIIAEALIDEAKALRKDGNYQEAISKINEALAVDPEYLHAHRMLSWTYWEMGDFDKSLEVALTTSQSFEGPEILCDIGDAYYGLKQDQAALNYYDRSLAQDPEYIAALHGKSLIALRKYDYKSAAEYCQKVLEIDPNNHMAYGRLGIIAERQEDFQNAFINYERAAALSDNTWEKEFEQIKERLRTKEKPAKPNCLSLLLAIPLLLILHLYLAPKADDILYLPMFKIKALWPVLPGFVLAFLFCKGKGMDGLHTILHELRHAALVILTGNSVTKFEFYSRRNKEEKAAARIFYRFRHPTLRRIADPFIATAPYFFPIVSITVLAACCFVPISYYREVLFTFGLAVGIDFGVAMKDFFNVNNLREGDFGHFRAGFTIGLPFVILANIIVLETEIVWLLWFLKY